MQNSDISLRDTNASFPHKETIWQWTPSIVLSFLALLLLASSLTANILISIAIFRFPKLRTNFNFYLLNIAVSDILFSIFSLLNFCPLMYYGYYPFSTAACTVWLYSEFIFSSVTESTMALVALDRLVCVNWPLFYRKHQSSKYSVIFIAVLWIWLNLLILPSVLLSRARMDNVDSERCSIDYEVYPGMLTACVILVFWVPETVTVITYARIAGTVRRKLVDTSSSNSLDSDIFRASGKGENDAQLPFRLEEITKSHSNYPDTFSTRLTRRANKDRKAFRLLSALVLSVLVFCVPADVYYFIAAVESKWATNGFHLLATFSTFIHCFLSPLLYHAYSEDMKSAVKTLLNLSS